MLIKETFNSIKQELDEVDSYILNFFKNEQEYLIKSMKYLLNAGGKRIRPACALMSAQYGKEAFGKAIPLAAALELIHMASLIHDDVIDDSQLRRGKVTIKALDGNNYALHLGVFLFAKALNIVEKYKNPKINDLLTRASVNICQGEIEQLDSAFNSYQNIRNYLFKVNRKTSLLIALSCQAGALAVDSPDYIVRCLGRYGHYIGMAYQIKDDVLDYISEEEALGKPVGSDLQQGLLTLPAIYVLQHGDQITKLQLKNIISKRELNKEDIKRAVELIRKGNALDYSLSIANKYVAKSIKELEGLPAVETTERLKGIAQFVKTRNF